MADFAWGAVAKSAPEQIACLHSVGAVEPKVEGVVHCLSVHLQASSPV